MKTKFLYFFLTLLLISCTDSHSQSKLKVIQAARNLVNIDSITDFSSNHNYPVPEIENIGPNLYARLRKLKRCGLKNFTHKPIDPREDVIDRFGEGDLYEVTYYYQNGQKQRYFVFSDSKYAPLRIIGF